MGNTLNMQVENWSEGVQQMEGSTFSAEMHIKGCFIIIRGNEMVK